MTVRDGRFGAYVNWGKVNATIPKGIAPDSISLSQALELLAEREGRPVSEPRSGAKASARTKAAPKKAPAKTAGSQRAPTKARARRGEESRGEGDGEREGQEFGEALARIRPRSLRPRARPYFYPGALNRSCAIPAAANT